ncbi:MAG: hypothetical protein WBF53_09615, partial [Litorimonas sp.]
MPASKRAPPLYMKTMFEVVLYAAIAAIICVAFYSVLGKSVGRGPEDAFKPDEVFGGSSDAAADPADAALAAQEA